jgi:hypothetical protein
MKLAMTAGILAASFLLNSNASAQVQSKAQQACINGQNKGMAKVSSTTAKVITSCTSDYAKGSGISVFACSFNHPKIESAQTKVCEAFGKDCTETPSFGATDCTYTGGAAESQQQGFWYDIFGGDAGVAQCDTDKEGCKCQSSAYRAALKFESAFLKVYNGCKKAGLASEDSPIVGVGGLIDCLNADPKLAKDKASAKLADTITNHCSIPVPFQYGDCSALTGTSLYQCLARTVRCRSCLAVNLADNLGYDCDAFDDLMSGNSSCF